MLTSLEKELFKKSVSLGANTFGKSPKKEKRYFVLMDGNKVIHFGSKTGVTFIDHKDIKKRDAWRARHSKIKLKDGRLAYKVREQPSYWAYNLLWS